MRQFNTYKTGQIRQSKNKLDLLFLKAISRDGQKILISTTQADNI